MGYDLINVRPIAGSIGAEIEGIDMSKPLGNQAFKEVHDALMAHQVIFFRDQDITPGEHVAFARQFGTLHVHPYAPSHEDHPEVLILKSSKANRSSANIWHSDVTFQEEPPLGSILLAREVPEAGGDTMWANMYDAYETLSDAMKRYLEGMKALNTSGHARFERAYDTLSDDEKERIRFERKAQEGVEHPIVRTHPVTGRKALYVNGIFTQKIVGVSRRESRAILDYLFDHLHKPEFTCRFRWEKGSVAFWDNRCTQHYAVADYGDATREMHRVTVNGDRPF
ncbi:MAG: taurine dioxygenase [Minwuia sp.]|uniref:taurine dioxygenase n=1 Tax=Minwuia sp. TaxID=2493630 RepID=UPI003A884200